MEKGKFGFQVLNLSIIFSQIILLHLQCTTFLSIFGRWGRGNLLTLMKAI